MPYKDRERKKQWEREHREERNARRRENRLAERAFLARHDPAVPQEPQSTWKTVLGWVVTIAFVALKVWSVASAPLPDTSKR